LSILVDPVAGANGRGQWQGIASGPAVTSKLQLRFWTGDNPAGVPQSATAKMRP